MPSSVLEPYCSSTSNCLLVLHKFHFTIHQDNTTYLQASVQAADHKLGDVPICACVTSVQYLFFCSSKVPSLTGWLMIMIRDPLYFSVSRWVSRHRESIYKCVRYHGLTASFNTKIWQHTVCMAVCELELKHKIQGLEVRSSKELSLGKELPFLFFKSVLLFHPQHLSWKKKKRNERGIFLPSSRVKTREKFHTWEASASLAPRGLPRPLHTAAPHVLLAFHAILSMGRTPAYYISPFEGLLTQPTCDLVTFSAHSCMQQGDFEKEKHPSTHVFWCCIKDKIYRLPEWNRSQGVTNWGWTVSFFLQRTSWLCHLTVFFEVGLKTLGHTHSRKKKTLFSKPHANNCRILCTFAMNSFFQVVLRVKASVRTRWVPSPWRASGQGRQPGLNFMPFSDVWWCLTCFSLGSQLDCMHLAARAVFYILILW